MPFNPPEAHEPLTHASFHPIYRGGARRYHSFCVCHSRIHRHPFGRGLPLDTVTNMKSRESVFNVEQESPFNSGFSPRSQIAKKPRRPGTPAPLRWPPGVPCSIDEIPGDSERCGLTPGIASCRRPRSSACGRNATRRWRKWPSRPGEFHPKPLTDPDLNLSIHPARVTARRLPPSVVYRAPPAVGYPTSVDPIQRR